MEKQVITALIIGKNRKKQEKDLAEWNYRYNRIHYIVTPFYGYPYRLSVYSAYWLNLIYYFSPPKKTGGWKFQ